VREAIQAAVRRIRAGREGTVLGDPTPFDDRDRD
jgi:hypothetical protein